MSAPSTPGAPPPASPAASPGARAPSRIRRRLAAWYAGTAVVVLVATLLALRGLVRGALEREFAHSLEASVQLVRGFFRGEVKEYRTVEATVYHIGGELVFADRELTFVRPDGSTAAVAPGRAAEAPRLEPPVRDTIAPLDPDLAPGWTIRLRHSQALVAAFERQLDVWYWGGIPAILVLAALAGWWLAGRTLAPVGAMADAAERVDAGNASARLPVADPHDELGRLASRFNAVLERLDGALGQQRRFLAAAAHELRTPVARLRATLDLARAEPEGATRTELLDAADKEIARTATLVDELMQLARADADAREVHLAPGFLDDIVSDAVAAFTPLALERGVALSVAALEEAPAQLDARLVERLVGILLDNALRYTPRDGTVTVRVERVDGQARLTVEDSGIGIAAAEAGRLFERFYRGAEARKQSPEGTGLGLAIAKWICDQHEATISASSRHNRIGARFEVAFPAVASRG